MFRFPYFLLLCTNASPVEKRDCRENVRLGAKGEFPLIMLSSIQGSGNTWTRMLIEGATGIYTGSKYNEKAIYERNGFIGELEEFDAGTTIAIKNHGTNYLEDSQAILLIVRNPYDAFKAEFNRKQTQRVMEDDGLKSRSHVGHADPAAFNTTVWDDWIKHVSYRWQKLYSDYVIKCDSMNIPIHVIYYENLKEDTVKEVKSILNFYNETINFVPDNVEDRIECLSQTTMDAFKRKKTELGWEIYKPELIELVNNAISHLRSVFEDYNIPTMPNYFKNLPTEESDDKSGRQTL